MEDKVRVEHIVDAIADIQIITKGMSYDDYVANLGSRWGLVKLFEIIGEAANKISKETQEKYPEVAWKQIIGTRNILVHDYNTIDFNLLWEIVEQEIPKLKDQMNYLHNQL